MSLCKTRDRSVLPLSSSVMRACPAGTTMQTRTALCNALFRRPGIRGVDWGSCACMPRTRNACCTCCACVVRMYLCAGPARGRTGYGLPRLEM